MPKVAPIVDTTRAAVAYFRGDAPVKYSRIKRRQRPGVNRDELDEWEPSPAPIELELLPLRRFGESENEEKKD
ncbi:hypothetical protein ALC56_03328 [Trachymyrmex septentrionalis]|uniref:Uncharacterized protein n=1 Tax=Trachymyrmex septentrionalis TaxID=34720 RepID=A0A195FNR6_9HYME|nr:hypothetical protein ALC56_03328 [Trachymyrmex septentrionalis]